MLKIIFNGKEMKEIVSSDEMIKLIKLHFATSLITNDVEQTDHIINEMTNAYNAWSKEKNMHHVMKSYPCFQWDHFIDDIKKMMKIDINAIVYVTMV